MRSLARPDRWLKEFPFSQDAVSHLSGLFVAIDCSVMDGGCKARDRAGGEAGVGEAARERLRRDPRTHTHQRE